jgi:hypothetical protein
MSDIVKSAAIIAVALVAVTGLYLYFSPYHSCVRALTASDYERPEAALACLHGEVTDPGLQTVGRQFARAPATMRSEWRLAGHRQN